MADHVAGMEALRAEVQEHAVSSADSGRPTVPVLADVMLHAICKIAVAWGGVPGKRGFHHQPGFSISRGFRLFREATQLTTEGTVVRAAGIEVLRAEAQEHAVSPADSGRPTVPAAFRAEGVWPCFLFAVYSERQRN